MVRAKTCGFGKNVATFSRRLGHSTLGAGAPEYALILALIVGAGAIGYLTLGRQAAHTLYRSANFANTLPGAGTGSSMTGASGHQAAAENPSRATMASGVTIAFMCLGLVAGIAFSSVSFMAWRARQKPSPDDSAETSDESNVAMQIPAGARKRLIEKRQQMCRLMTRGLDNTTSATIEARHLMSQRLMTVPPTMPATEAVDTMNAQHIRHLLVCKADGTLVGIVSDRDVKERNGATVTDIMTPEPLTITPETELGVAITIMLNNAISGLPVVEDDHVCGFLSTTDLILSLQCVLQTFKEIASGAKEVSQATT